MKNSCIPVSNLLLCKRKVRAHTHSTEQVRVFGCSGEVWGIVHTVQEII